MKNIFYISLLFTSTLFSQSITIENGTGFNRTINLQIKNKTNVSNDYIMKKTKEIMFDLLHQYSCLDLKNGQKMWIDVWSSSFIIDTMRLISESAELNYIPDIDYFYKNNDYKSLDDLIIFNTSPNIYKTSNIEIDYYDTIRTIIDGYVRFKTFKTYKTTAIDMLLVSGVIIHMDLKFGYLCNNIWHDYNETYNITPIENLKRIEREKNKFAKDFKRKEDYSSFMNHLYFINDSIKNVHDIDSILPIINKRREETYLLFVNDSINKINQKQISDSLIIVEKNRRDSINLVIKIINDSIYMQNNKQKNKQKRKDNIKGNFFVTILFVSSACLFYLSQLF